MGINSNKNDNEKNTMEDITNVSTDPKQRLTDIKYNNDEKDFVYIDASVQNADNELNNDTTNPIKVRENELENIESVLNVSNTDNANRKADCKTVESNFTSQKVKSDFDNSETLPKCESNIWPDQDQQSTGNKYPFNTGRPESVVDMDKSITSDELPTYLNQGTIKSGKGRKIGSESLITDNDLLLAATLVANAMVGKTFEVKREPRYVRSYNLYKSKVMCVMLYMAILCTLGLAAFEKPAMQNLEIPYWITMSIEVCCQMIFVFRICHQKHWRVPKGFKKDLKMIFAIACTVFTFLDMLVFILVRNLTDFNAVRYSRPLRPLFIFFFSDGVHLKRAWSNIRISMVQISHVIVLFYFLIAVFALVAIKIFHERTDITFPDGRDYFKNYFESFWELYVLVTTANNPDVMMPAYEDNRLYCIFFTSYIILCLYLILNILLAVTYNSYRENMKIQIKHSAHLKKEVLNQAFEVIKINVDGNEMVTYKTWIRLINLAHPGVTKHQADLLMMVLDTDKTGFISRKQFSNIADLLNVPISVVSERKNFMELHCKTIYNSRISKAVRKGVESMYFSLAYDGLVFVNVILIALNVKSADWAFCSLYILEIALKWYTFGTKRYLNSLSNWTDLTITVISLIILIVTEIHDTNKLGVFNVFRIFRVLRFLTDFERFRIIFDAVFNVSYSIMTYCVIIFIVFYIYAIIGMELFADLIKFDANTNVDELESTPLINMSLNESSNIYLPDAAKYCYNVKLNNSMFVANHYCNVNFNDVLNSVVLIASLLIVNNWHVISEGYVLVTNKAARFYFMSFHLLIAVVIMNIVTAFILDMFMYEYTFSKKGNLDTKVEMTIKQLQLGIDDETGMEITDDLTSKEGDSIDGIRQRESMFHTKHLIQKLASKQNAHAQVKPNLSRYDGIRFHMKKRDWNRTELLLQQLFELEEEVAEYDKDHQLISMLNQ